MTQKKTVELELAIQEYTDEFPPPNGNSIDWISVEAKLHRDMGWTQEGAVQVAALARDYGAFVLRNALALAITLGIEDGELGF